MIDNINDIEQYKGHDLYVTRENAIPLEEGEYYLADIIDAKVVTEEGSIPAQKLIKEWMEPCDSQWRGLGMIKNSGLRLRKEAQDFDARVKFSIPKMEGRTSPACRCGDVLQGKCRPTDCKVFGKGCTPLHPIGACMVSNEGACSAYYQYNSRGE